MSTKPLWEYTNDEAGSFLAKNPDRTSRLFYPLMNEAGMKCSVTPELKGDISFGFDQYLVPPVVTEDLNKTQNARYFWVQLEGEAAWNINGLSPEQQLHKWDENYEESKVLARPGSFTLQRSHHSKPITAEVTLTVPQTKDAVEIWKISIKNHGEKALKCTPWMSLPLFGRHADNLRDHRQVTSMFQYVKREKHGVVLKPSIVHDEHGHRVNSTQYFVYGYGEAGVQPDRVFTRMQDFVGEGGNLSNPEAIIKNLQEPKLEAAQRNGVDSVAALSFAEKSLAPGEELVYVCVVGITADEAPEKIASRYNSIDKFNTSLQKTNDYWNELVNQVEFNTGQANFDSWTKWLAFQLKCRQIYGNSFLPDFGYGRGGRGWRDLWQDLLSIFLVDPESAKNEIVNNLKGIRMDGSNATIIGNQPGEFKADRNNIARTWCDHGAWPLFALNFYIQQTGDVEILLQNIPYWKDQFVFRSQEIDEAWTAEEGNCLLTRNGEIYQGSVLEHVLLQQLSAFYHVGEHNLLLLEGADWNDTLDMARNRGESACFQSFYAGNLEILIKLMGQLKSKGILEIKLAEEVALLLDRTMKGKPINYEVIQEKRGLLNEYFLNVKSRITGSKLGFGADELIQDLQSKENHAKKKIQTQEWIALENGEGYFNGHYDDLGQAMHGKKKEGYRMDLTSQVIPTMFNVATDEQVPKMYKAARKLLTDQDSPGVKLCTPYPEIDMNIGRVTGFVYGFKEHGSKWMQQNVMFMYGLYHRNQYEAGFEMFQDVFEMTNNSSISKTFPGIPSFYEPDNRGAYMYLTGSSTWIFLSLVTQVFGVRGIQGQLLIQPKIATWFFDETGKASITVNFNGKRISVDYFNPNKLEPENYSIQSATINGVEIGKKEAKQVVISKQEIESFGSDSVTLRVNLG